VGTSWDGGVTAAKGVTRRVLVIALALGLVAVVLATRQLTADDGREISTGSGAIAATETTTTLAPPVLGAPRTIAVHATRSNGRTRIEESLRCDGSEGVAGYWHLQGEDKLSPGTLTAPSNPLPGDLRLFADLHSPHHTVRVSPEPLAAPGPTTQSAYLLPDASRVAMSNARGTVKLVLTSGGCTRAGQTFDFDGSHAAGVGTWAIESGTGSYRSAAANGDFTLQASVLPGADNPWTLDLTGAIRVLQPQLTATVVDTYWGRDGVDYLKRQVAAVYRVTNVGAGDSFGTALTAASSPTPGASLLRIVINGKHIIVNGNTPVGAFPRSLGDLASGEDTEITLVWQLPAVGSQSVCKLVILGCEIDTVLTFSAPDALDLPTTHSATNKVRAPDLPPPT
jgi:hypothetical protein